MFHLQPADYAWLTLVVAAVAFEFTSDDLLSHSTARLVARHPVLARLGIFLVAGHLAVALPRQVDVFNDANVVHRRVARMFRK